MKSFVMQRTSFQYEKAIHRKRYLCSVAKTIAKYLQIMSARPAFSRHRVILTYSPETVLSTSTTHLGTSSLTFYQSVI